MVSRVPDALSRIVTLVWLKVMSALIPAVKAGIEMRQTVDVGMYKEFLRYISTLFWTCKCICPILMALIEVPSTPLMAQSGIDCRVTKSDVHGNI